MEFVLLVAVVSVFIIFMIIISERILVKSILHNVEIKTEEKKSDRKQFPGEQDFYITSSDGIRTFCAFIPNDESGNKPEKVVVLLHGLNGSSDDMRKFVPFFIEKGISVVIPDARCCGSSSGGILGYGYLDQSELQAVIKWICDFCGEIPIGFLGIATGAAEALYGMMNNKAAFVVSDSTYSDLDRFFKDRIHADYKIRSFPIYTIARILIRYHGLDIQKASPIKMLKKSENDTPVFFIHGESDTFILPQMSIDLYNAKNKGYKKFWLAPESGHGKAYDILKEEYEQKLSEFLTKIGFIEGHR